METSTLENKNNKIKQYLIPIFLIIVFFGFGVYVGAANKTEIEKVTGISGKETAVASTADFSPFWQVWNTVNEKYPGADKVSDQDKIYGAISGLVGSLNDPYTAFFKPDEAKSFQEEIAGNFGGIGLEVGIKDKILTVISALKDTPAYRADIKPGDKIIKIDNTVTTNLSIDDAIKLIRGEKGTTVTLTTVREGNTQPKEIKIVRDIIAIPTLDTVTRSDGIFVIKLYSFSENSANLFKNAMKEFVNSKDSKLILDLRGNPGGYLDAAVDMASWFLKSGTTVVTEDYGNAKTPEVFRSKGYDIFTDKLQFIILMDGGSASASEILAGAMQDNGRAKIVGTQSFGKGSVQEVVHITKDTILKVTVAKWLTPNGTSISEKGLTPDYPVDAKVPARTTDAVQSGGDPQMDKAVELLGGKKL